MYDEFSTQRLDSCDSAAMDELESLAIKDPTTATELAWQTIAQAGVHGHHVPGGLLRAGLQGLPSSCR